MALQIGEVEIAYNLKTENLIDFENNDDFEIQELDSLFILMQDAINKVFSI